MRLRMFGATDPGLVRANNQDNYFCSSDFGIVIVSDGMGGHKGGEIASRLVVEGLRDAYLQSDQILAEQVGSFLDETLSKINMDILGRSRKDSNLKGMGATVDYLQYAGDTVVIGHAGDSRSYLLKSYERKGKGVRTGIWCLTVDHNVGTFLKRGLLIPGRDIAPPPHSEKVLSRLTRGMGLIPDLKADLYYRSLDEGDVYLTCSDGVHGFISDEAILRAVCAGPIEEAPKRIIEVVKKKGAPDNITVVLTIVGEAKHPLRSKEAKDKFIDKPFLLRMPSGEITGLHSSKDIIEKWTHGSLPGDCEVAGPFGSWVFLEKPAQVLRRYPSLQTSEMNEFVKRMQPDTDIKSIVGAEEYSSKNGQAFRFVFLILLLIATAAIYYFQLYKK